MHIPARTYAAFLTACLLFLTGYSFESAVDVYDQGVTYGTTGDFDAAREQFEAALKIDPSYAPPKGSLQIINDARSGKIARETAQHFFTAFALSHQGQNRAALQELNRAVAFDPQYANAYLNRGGMYLKLGRYDKALDDFSAAIELDPESYSAYHNRGMVYINFTNNIAQGCQDYKKACELGLCGGYKKLKNEGKCG